jgi:mono/diheme cytochrome c family protein
VRAVAILGETLLELWLLLGVFMRWSGAAPVGRLVMKGALLLVFALSGVTALDRSQAGSLDAINADAPLDPTHPFAGTRSEALLKARYREPDASVLLARVSGVSSQGLTPVRVSAPMTPSIPAALMSKAVKLYELRCAACHGAKGDGKGPGAFAVKPKPRDYTDPAWQATVTDDELGKAIVRGGAGVGKSYMMPASPDLKAKPEMVAALVALVRSFAGGGTLTAEAKR